MFYSNFERKKNYKPLAFNTVHFADFEINAAPTSFNN